MTESDWTYLAAVARGHDVTLAEAGVTRLMTLGNAIDSIFLTLRRRKAVDRP
jgi:hypothetical protein